MRIRQTVAIAVLMLGMQAEIASARVYKCVQGDTTVFSQDPCTGQVEVIDSESLRPNSLPPPEPRTKKLSNTSSERTTAHPALSALARSRLLNLEVEVERWLRSSADKSERERLLRDIKTYSARLEQIKQQVKDSRAISVQMDSEEAQLRRDNRTNRALLARKLFEHEMLRNQRLYGVQPLKTNK